VWGVSFRDDGVEDQQLSAGLDRLADVLQDAD
jgi:hypothetical protein